MKIKTLISLDKYLNGSNGFSEKAVFFKIHVLPTLYCFVPSGMLTLFLFLQWIVRRNPLCIFTAVTGMTCSSVRTAQDCLLGNVFSFLANAQGR